MTPAESVPVTQFANPSGAPIDQDSPSSVHIVDVTALVVNAALRNWVFVKVTTSEPDLVGWGEATLEWKTNAIVGALADLRPLLLGLDVMRTEHAWQTLFRGQFFKDDIVTMSAISGIDQALLDIKGKLLGVPVYQLLGGQVRDRVRLYDHIAGGNTAADYERLDPHEVADYAQRSIEDGFSALKLLVVPTGGMLAEVSGVRRARAVMQALREAIGWDVDIMIDLHGRTTAAAAVRYGRAVAEYDPWFLEEPCQPDDLGGLRDVGQQLGIPIATGERLTSRHQFRALLDHRACAVIQPDVCHCGGLTEIKRLAAMAEAAHVAIAPHNPLGPIATAANIHMAYSTPNFLIQEIVRADVPWRGDVVDMGIEFADGHASLPTRPGLGVLVDETAAAAHPYFAEPQITARGTDGAVVDW